MGERGRTYGGESKNGERREEQINDDKEGRGEKGERKIVRRDERRKKKKKGEEKKKKE